MKQNQIMQQARETHVKRTGIEPELIGAAPGTWVMMGDGIDAYQGIVIAGQTEFCTAAALHLREDDIITFSCGDTQLSSSFEALNAEDTDPYAKRIVGLLHTLIQRQVLSRETTGMDITVVSDVPLGAGLGALASIDAAIAVACASNHKDINTPPFRAKLAEVCAQAATTYCSQGFIAPIRSRYTVALRGDSTKLNVIDYADGSLTTLTHPSRFKLHPLIIAPREHTAYWHDPERATNVRKFRELLDAAQANFGVTTLRQLPDATNRVVQWVQARAQYGDNTAPDPQWVRSWLEFCEAETQRTTLLLNAMRAQQLPQVIAVLRESMQRSILPCPHALIMHVLELGALTARPAAAAVSDAVLAFVASEDLAQTRAALAADYAVFEV